MSATSAAPKQKGWIELTNALLDAALIVTWKAKCDVYLSFRKP